MRIPVPSPYINLQPGYINVMQTILIKLTMAGLFQGRPQYIQSIQQKAGRGKQKN